MDDLKAEIRKEHYRAELQRLNKGMEGCGCSLCQELYKTMDLSKYGTRVKHYGDFVMVAAKQVVKIKEKEENTPPSEKQVVDTPTNEDGTHHNQNLVVSKFTTEEVIGGVPKTILHKGKKTGVLKHRGRPRKNGQLSRMTEWRRQKEKEKQLAMGL